MMSNRPKDPKTARNKNVLVVGGSGSGKTRFFIKPNLMQLHSSYVVTDPKDKVIIVRTAFVGRKVILIAAEHFVQKEEPQCTLRCGR